MTTTKEEQIRAAFIEHALSIAPFDLSIDADGDFYDIGICSRWLDWKACAESYDKKLAEKDAEIAKWRRGFEVYEPAYRDIYDELTKANAHNAVAQLHIKKLRDALERLYTEAKYQSTKGGWDNRHELEVAANTLAKQPDPRALNKE